MEFVQSLLEKMGDLGKPGVKVMMTLFATILITGYVGRTLAGAKACLSLRTNSLFWANGWQDPRLYRSGIAGFCKTIQCFTISI
jgi:hypothetical protein